MAYVDLGGLGSKQGAPKVVDWKAPSMVPAALPWLTILALLALKSNRTCAAWWIWAPLLCLAGLGLVPQSVLSFMPSSQALMFLEWMAALGFGLAALWLVAGLLQGKHRILTFLAMLATQGVVSAVAFALLHGQDSDTPGMVVPVGLGALAFTVALSLAGWACRGRYGWLRLSLWLVLMTAVVWAVVITPFFVFALVARGGQIPVTALLGAELMATLFTVGLALPFLILAFVNGFYRERLKGLLHLGAEPPPVVEPLGQVLPATASPATNAGPGG